MAALTSMTQNVKSGPKDINGMAKPVLHYGFGFQRLSKASSLIDYGLPTMLQRVASVWL